MIQDTYKKSNSMMEWQRPPLDGKSRFYFFKFETFPSWLLWNCGKNIKIDPKFLLVYNAMKFIHKICRFIS